MSVFDFSCMSIDGEVIPLENYRGKALLIVNTASKCGFTPQYKGLERLWRDYHSAGLVVMGFPCDQFLNEEFSTEEEIENFCVRSYSITFPLFAKTRVRGESIDPLFHYLCNSASGVFGSKRIKWNFTKFLVSRDGLRIKRFAPAIYPAQLRRHIEKYLHEKG